MAYVKPGTEKAISSGGSNFMGDVRKVTGHQIFKLIFDPLGVTDSAFAKFAPDEVVGEEIKYSDFEDTKLQADLARLRDFYAKLAQPIDMQDPATQRIVGAATTQAQRQASSQGVRGGMAITNTQARVSDSLAGYDTQRKQQYGQGMAQLAQLQQQANDAQYAKYMNALNREQGQMDQLRSDVQQRNSGILGVAGGIIGGLFGAPELGQAVGNVSGGQSVSAARPIAGSNAGFSGGIGSTGTQSYSTGGLTSAKAGSNYGLSGV